MSIASGTTHYGYPQVQLTDRPTFADFNPAFADIDSKLYGLITGAETDEQAIRDLGTAVSGLTDDLGNVSDTATGAKNKADANEEAITLLSNQVSQNATKLGTKIDSNAIAEPYDASGTYAVDDVVTYQGQRYRCITAVAVAEPFDATKWTGEDVETVLEHLQDEIDNIPTPTVTAADVTLAPIIGMTADDVQEGIGELKTNLGDIDNLVTTNKSSVVAAINEVATSGGSTTTYPSEDVYTPTVTGSTCRAIKADKVVTLNLLVNNPSGVSTNSLIGTLKVGFRPKFAYGVYALIDQGTGSQSGFVYVSSNGEIKATSSLSSSTSYVTLITYVVE